MPLASIELRAISTNAKISAGTMLAMKKTPDKGRCNNDKMKQSAVENMSEMSVAAAIVSWFKRVVSVCSKEIESRTLSGCRNVCSQVLAIERKLGFCCQGVPTRRWGRDSMMGLPHSGQGREWSRSSRM